MKKPVRYFSTPPYGLVFMISYFHITAYAFFTAHSLLRSMMYSFMILTVSSKSSEGMNKVGRSNKSVFLISNPFIIADSSFFIIFSFSTLSLLYEGR